MTNIRYALHPCILKHFVFVIFFVFVFVFVCVFVIVIVIPDVIFFPMMHKVFGLT